MFRLSCRRVPTKCFLWLLHFPSYQRPDINRSEFIQLTTNRRNSFIMHACNQISKFHLIIGISKFYLIWKSQMLATFLRTRGQWVLIRSHESYWKVITFDQIYPLKCLRLLWAKTWIKPAYCLWHNTTIIRMILLQHSSHIKFCFFKRYIKIQFKTTVHKSVRK